MKEEYHRQVTAEALGDQLSHEELEIVIQANVGQDGVWNWLTTPERHYDGRFFAKAEAYIDEERARAVDAFHRGDRVAALQAMGRLLHTRQDFYSHSNWMQHCAAKGAAKGAANTAHWDAADPAICLDTQADPQIFGVRAPFLIHALYVIPILGPLIKRIYLPADYHEAMHLDDPSRGPLFAPSLVAARKHTRLEWERVMSTL
ncbi:hypothetical protein GC175_00880 [bacterium]|nr:hypothetical protein [bacterium]